MAAKQRTPDEVFSELVTQNQTRIYGYIYGLVHNSADTDDLLQSTLMSLWKRFDDFQKGTDFGAWAIATARFEVLRFHQSRKRTSVFTEELIQRLADHFSADIEAESTRREALQACVEELAPTDQQLLDSRYYQQQKVREIAAELDRSERSLSNSLTRIRGQLFDCVRRRLAQEARS